MGESVRVFLSWSGQKSHEVALALRNWLHEIVNDLDPWMSSEDIAKGDFAFYVDSGQLEGPAESLKVEDFWEFGPAEAAKKNLGG